MGPNVACWVDQEVADRTCSTFWTQALEKEETQREEAVCGAFGGNHALPGPHLASFTTCSWVLYRLDLFLLSEPSADIWTILNLLPLCPIKGIAGTSWDNPVFQVANENLRLKEELQREEHVDAYCLRPFQSWDGFCRHTYYHC